MQGKDDLVWCKISQNYCDDDCDHCLEWLCVCDQCFDYGHTDSGNWYGDFITNTPMVYCEDCAFEKGLIEHQNGMIVYTVNSPQPVDKGVK